MIGGDPIVRPENRALKVAVSIALLVVAFFAAILVAQAVARIVAGVTRDGVVYATSTLTLVTALLTLAAPLLLFGRRPLGWALGLTLAMYQVGSRLGLGLFSALVEGPEAPTGKALAHCLLWIAITGVFLHPRVRHACNAPAVIWPVILGAVTTAIVMTLLAYFTVAWDFDRVS